MSHDIPRRRRRSPVLAVSAATLLAAMAVVLSGCATPSARRAGAVAEADASPTRTKSMGPVQPDRPPPPKPPVPSGGAWEVVGSVECAPQARPKHGRLVHVYTHPGWTREHPRDAIRAVDFASGTISELHWSSGDVSLPTLIDETHVLFSSDNEYICVADIPAGTAEVVADQKHYGGLGYRAASREIAYTDAGSRAPESGPRQYFCFISTLPFMGSQISPRSPVEWAPVGGNTVHRRLRFSPDGAFVSLPCRPTDVSRSYDVARWSTGEHITAWLDTAPGGLSYGAYGRGLEFGVGCLYAQLNRELPEGDGGPDQVLVRYALSGTRPRVGTLLRKPPDVAWLGGCVAVSEELGVVVLSIYADHDSRRTDLRIASLDRRGDLVRLCEGDDPDICPK